MLRFRQHLIYLSLCFKRFDFEGEDVYGNRYYKKIVSQAGEGKYGEKRIVLYRGSPEAAHICPEWYRWIHFICQESPLKETSSGHIRRCSPTMRSMILGGQDPLKFIVRPQKSSYIRWSPENEPRGSNESI